MSKKTIRVALDWTFNTLHAGLVLAAAKGLYAEQGLEVHLLPPDSTYSITPAKLLHAGEVDLAICPSESCIAYNESGEMRLQAIYAILQRDASAIVGTTLNSMRELGQGKTYGSYNARFEDGIVRAMVRKDGGDWLNVRVERAEGKLSMFDALKAGRIDAAWVFLPWEGVEAEAEGVALTRFRLEDYGIPYGYSPVIARNAGARSLADEDLAAFVAATREGYQHAIKHPHDAVEILHRHCQPPRSKDFLRRSQAAINHFYSDGRAPGQMNARKWAEWIEWLKANELLEETAKLKLEDIYTLEFASPHSRRAGPSRETGQN